MSMSYSFTAGRNLAQDFARSSDTRDRAQTRLALNLPLDQVMLLGAGQPYFFGGGAQTLSKLVFLHCFKHSIPGALSTFGILSREAASADRDMYRCRFQVNGNVVQFGMSRQSFHAEVCVNSVFVTPADLKMWRDEVHRLGWSLPGSVDVLFDAQENLSLAQFNSQVLQRLAAELGIAPDYWIDIVDAEWAVAQSGFWHNLISRWDEFAQDFNSVLSGQARPLLPVDAPIWCYDNSGLRHRITRNGDLCSLNTTQPQVCNVAMEALPGIFQNFGWRLGFRAVPRVFALSTIFDGQVTGPGSRYNEALYSMRLGLLLMPRFICPDELTKKLRVCQREKVPGAAKWVLFPVLAFAAEIGVPKLRMLIEDVVRNICSG